MFFKQSLQKKALRRIEAERVADFVSLENVQSIALLMSGVDRDILEAKAIIEKNFTLKDGAFRVICIGCEALPKKGELELELPIISIYKRDLNYYGLPRNKDLAPVLKQGVDLFIDATTSKDFSSLYISKRVNASFKVGRSILKENPFDFVLEGTEELPVVEFLNRVLFYLKNIKS